MPPKLVLGSSSACRHTATWLLSVPIPSCASVSPPLFFKTNNKYCLFILVDNFNVGIRFSFSVDFRTENCSGVLLYIASSIFPDHVLVELRGGRVSLK